MFMKLPALPSILLSVMLASCGGGGGGSSGGGTTTSPLISHPPGSSTHRPNRQQRRQVALNGIDPATADNGDLASFSSAVGDRQIVLLTEPTHGDGANLSP